MSVESCINISLPTITLLDSVEPRCAYQCSAVLAGYEMSDRMWAPTRVYPGPFSIRGSVSQEIVEWITILKYREKFPNVAGILFGSWQFCNSLVNFCCHSRWFLGIWKIILGVRPLERCSAALLRIMKALIIQFHRSSHYFVSFDSKCCQHFISVVLLLGWVTELRFIKRRG